MILFEKFGQHQPLNRQAERYAREGVPLSLSTLADQVGACCAVLAPLLRRIEAHVLAAERLHGDDTTVPVLAPGRTTTGRCWVYVRDDRPFGGGAAAAAAKPGKRSVSPWLLALLARKPRKLAAVALANKIARTVWAMIARGEAYRHMPVAA